MQTPCDSKVESCLDLQILQVILEPRIKIHVPAHPLLRFRLIKISVLSIHIWPKLTTTVKQGVSRDWDVHDCYMPLLYFTLCTVCVY